METIRIRENRARIIQYLRIITRVPNAYGLYSRVQNIWRTNERSEWVSEIFLTSEYNPYKRGTRVIIGLLYTKYFCSENIDFRSEKSVWISQWKYGTYFHYGDDILIDI